MWWVGTKKKYQIKEKFSIYPIRSHYFERIQNVGFSFEIIKKLKFSVDFQKFSVKNTKILRKIWTFTVNSNELKMSDFHWQNPKMSEIVVSYRFSDIFWSKTQEFSKFFRSQQVVSTNHVISRVIDVEHFFVVSLKILIFENSIRLN